MKLSKKVKHALIGGAVAASLALGITLSHKEPKTLQLTRSEREQLPIIRRGKASVSVSVPLKDTGVFLTIGGKNKPKDVPMYRDKEGRQALLIDGRNVLHIWAKNSKWSFNAWTMGERVKVFQAGKMLIAVGENSLLIADMEKEVWKKFNKPIKSIKAFEDRVEVVLEGNGVEEVKIK